MNPQRELRPLALLDLNFQKRYESSPPAQAV